MLKGRFNRTGRRDMPTLNTSSLPDLIFTLLFFFMIVTTMRESRLKVEFTVPQAAELERLERKSLVTYLYVGRPAGPYRVRLGEESCIQLNDVLADTGDIRPYIEAERARLSEADRPRMQVSLKIDENTQMGIVADIKEVLRKVHALNVNYSARKREGE